MCPKLNPEAQDRPEGCRVLWTRGDFTICPARTFSTAPGTHSHTRSWLGVHDEVRLLFGPQSAGLQAVQLPAPTWE